MNIETIAEALKVGQVSPPELVTFKDWLAGTSSQLMDRQMELKVLYAGFFEPQKIVLGSDKAVLMAWHRTPLGLEELQIETKQRKIKVLLGAISSHLKVASDQARNMY